MIILFFLTLSIFRCCGFLVASGLKKNQWKRTSRTPTKVRQITYFGGLLIADAKLSMREIEQSWNTEMGVKVD